MEINTISLTSNIANRIQKIRDGVVYQEKTAFVAELIQNAQRAKAKHIWITTGDGYFKITDDGRGCLSPEHVFTLDFSGWGTDVYSPFGEGFSSLFVIADYIIVRSNDWQADFNLKEALCNNDFNNIVVRTITKREGFQVEVFYDPAILSTWEIESQIEKIGAMTSTINTYLNGDKIDKAVIKYDPFCIKRCLRGFGQAIIAPAKGYGPVEVIYEGRPVRNIYWDGIKGLLAVKPGAITLKAPDRRDIVVDTKYIALESRMKKLSKELMSVLVKDYPEHISSFSQSIQSLLSPSQYAKHLTYRLKGKPKRHHPVSCQYCAAELTEEETIVQQSPTTSQHIIYPGVENEEESDSDLEIKKIRRLVHQAKIFYRLEPEHELQDLQSKIEYHGFTVLVVDELHAKALEWLNVPHLCADAYKIEETYLFQNVGARNNKERRLLALLTPIEKHYQLPSNTITFGDIKSVVKTLINGKTMNRTIDYPYGVCSKQGLQTRIILSRKQLGIRRLLGSYNSELGTAKDLKALVVMFPTIAHELAHLLHGTVDNTTKHYKTIEAIQHELSAIIADSY